MATADCAATTTNDLERIAGQVTVDCVVEIENTALVSLSGLEGLAAAGGITIRHNSQLADINSIVTLEAPVFYADFSPLPGTLTLPIIDDIELANTETSVIESARATSGPLKFYSLPELMTIRMPQVAMIDEIRIHDAPLLRNIDESFPELVQLGALSVKGCPLITTAEIDELSAHLPLTADAVHCGNADDAPCE